MKIIELGDSTAVIMKDSEDYLWQSLAKLNDFAKRTHSKLGMRKAHTHIQQDASEFLYSGRRLFLFFKDNIKDDFDLGDSVEIYVF